MSSARLRAAEMAPALKRRLSSMGSAEKLLLQFVPMRNSTVSMVYSRVPLTSPAKTRSKYMVTDTTKTIRQMALWCPRRLESAEKFMWLVAPNMELMVSISLTTLETVVVNPVGSRPVHRGKVSSILRRTLPLRSTRVRL